FPALAHGRMMISLDGVGNNTVSQWSQVFHNGSDVPATILFLSFRLCACCNGMVMTVNGV
ncbi:hypothetical protein J6590_011209, partial [Homalodisca vitripennis]